MVTHGTSANIAMSLMQRADAMPFLRPTPRSKPRGGLVLLSASAVLLAASFYWQPAVLRLDGAPPCLPPTPGPALFWHGTGPTQQQYDLLRLNWPRILTQRWVRPLLSHLPTAAALTVRKVTQDPETVRPSPVRGTLLLTLAPPLCPWPPCWAPAVTAPRPPVRLTSLLWHSGCPRARP